MGNCCSCIGRERYYTHLATFDYESRTINDLELRYGDKLLPCENNGAQNGGGFLKAKNVHTGKEGYVPSNHIAPKRTLEAEPWFFQYTTRLGAENMLSSNRNGDGSFLIRTAECQDQIGLGHNYSLSIRRKDTEKNIDSIGHFRVFIRLNQGRSEVSMNSSFNTLYPSVQALIERHSHKQKIKNYGLLKRPCVRTEKPMVPGLGHDQWEIKRTSLKKEKDLGSGQFGQVYLATWRQEAPPPSLFGGCVGKNPSFAPVKVAVKEMQSGKMATSDFIAEANIMKELNHPKLVKLLAVCTTGETICIVTELMPNGALKEYLENVQKSNQKLETKDMIYMAAQVAHGMSYLEKNNFVHRDLAARNVLVGDDHTCKVADFGLAKCLKEEIYNPQSTKCKFPVKWTAPEGLDPNRREFSTKSDVWSFGILLAEIVTYGKHPYPDINAKDMFVKLTIENYRMPRMRGCPREPRDLYEDFMLKCWAADPKDRPTFSSLHDQLENFFKDDYQYAEPEPGYGAAARAITTPGYD